MSTPTLQGVGEMKHVPPWVLQKGDVLQRLKEYAGFIKTMLTKGSMPMPPGALVWS